MILCTSHLQVLNVAGKDLRYHKECYKEVTNKTKLKEANNALKKIEPIRQTKPICQTESMDKKYLRKTEKPPDEQHVRSLRSQGVIFKKDRCIFCQEKEGVIHKVVYMATGSKF